ncbi:MAG TPA: DUF58 domain-containing protein [Gemmataceae bacterium]|nr:DUF58 domain-containing protein [Gemmataceae bacterium]
MSTAERYLNPNVIAQVGRLDLRAKFIVEGFLSGLHASPFQGFSVEFSEHRKYSPGDDLKDLDWNVYAKTDRYYVKKFQAETNVTGYLVMDLSASMDWCGVREMEKAKVGGTHHLRTSQFAEQGERLTKFEYSICLAAALGYLMIHQQDPVALVTCADKIRDVIPPRSKRTQLGNILALLANLKPAGQTDLAHGLHQLAAMIRTKSLIMVFSDLLTDPDPLLKALYHLRHRGNEIILFHVLDEAEVEFPFEGLVEFVDVESAEEMQLDAKGMREDYQRGLQEFQSVFKEEASKANIDYVPLHTGITFDKALIEYLISRQRRF